MDSTKLKMSAIWLILLSCFFIDLTQCEEPKGRLEIYPKSPSVRHHPVGRNLMFTCRPIVKDVNLVTDLQWRDNLNNTVLPKTPGERAGPQIYTEMLPGDQGLALMFSVLTEAMAGTYTCTASYSNDLLETSVKIETYVPVTWTDAPENQYPILGSDYVVKCKVTATPSPTVNWMRNGDTIRTSSRMMIKTEGLLIRNVQEVDDGIYTCRAFVIETGELVERHIRVEVYIKPVIQALPGTLEAVEGQQFSTFCNATGKPVPEYIWIKDKTQQNVATADRFLVNPQTGLLTITEVHQDDYGTYTCQAKNDAGATSSKTLLNVLVRPKIYEFYNVSKVIDREVAITCRATGRPAPIISFRRWGTEDEFAAGQQVDDDRITLEQYSDNDKGESTATLRISKLLRTDDGLYQCVARNKGDTAYRTGHITAEFPPSFDHMRDLPPVFSWEERKANLSCLAMGIPNATIEWRWNGRLIKEQYDKHLTIVGTGPQSDLLVLPVARQYYSVYKCIASNLHGTNEIDMELREARIPEAVVSATPKVVTATTVTFNIIGPMIERGLPILAYAVQYKDTYNPDWSQARNKSWSPDSAYIVEGLRPQTSFDFRFAARNQVGLGPWSVVKTQSTAKRSAPEEPKTLHKPVQEDDDESIVVSPYSDHFELRWSVPADNGEPIDQYQIKYCQGLKVNGEWNEFENDCITREVLGATSFEMSRLNGNTYYRIELRAHNAIGFSKPAGFIMKTARGLDVVLKVDKQVLTSAAIVGIAIGGVLLILIIVDFLCCVTLRMGVLASMCRRTKRSPSDIDEETKLGSGQLVKEPPPSPLPLPPPVKLGGSPMASPLDEKQPLNTPPGSIMKNSSVEFDGKFVHSRSGEILGKNSAV